MSKKRVAALGASAASAALVGSALFAPAAIAQDDSSGEPTPSAYAIGADGLLNVAKTPHAVGDADPKPVVEVPGDPVVHVEALDAMSEPGKAKSQVAGIDAIKLPDTQLPGIQGNPEYLIEADVIKATCTQGDLDSKIASLKIAGQTIPVDTNPNTGVPAPLDQVLDVTINEQADNADGSSTVNAVSVKVLKGADKLTQDIPILGKLIGQTITLSSATCAPQDGGNGDDGNGDDGNGDDGNGDGGNGDDGNGDGGNGDGGNGDGGNGDGGNDEANEDGTAPAPDPQPGHIAVTG